MFIMYEMVRYRWAVVGQMDEDRIDPMLMPT